MNIELLERLEAFGRAEIESHPQYEKAAYLSGIQTMLNEIGDTKKLIIIQEEMKNNPNLSEDDKELLRQEKRLCNLRFYLTEEFYKGSIQYGWFQWIPAYMFKYQDNDCCAVVEFESFLARYANEIKSIKKV